MLNQIFIKKCQKLIDAYKTGKLGFSKMPEESNPGFTKNEQELRLAYFTFPMALNYQRDSYKLWESALKTILDPDTRKVFFINDSVKMSELELRTKLTKYKLALQPNKHVNTWNTLANSIDRNWGSLVKMFDAAKYDFLILRDEVQIRHKKEFPYLSGPKIFNYWSFILMEYGNVTLKNAKYIEIAPDTHIIKGSVRLDVITEKEAEALTRDEISRRWRRLLVGSGISPIQMHAPLWFWSRNNFMYKLD